MEERNDICQNIHSFVHCLHLAVRKISLKKITNYVRLLLYYIIIISYKSQM